MIKAFLGSFLFALVLASCSSPSPPAPVLLSNPMAYMAAPLQQSSPITSRRFDIGHYQASDTYFLPDGTAILSWSYSPWGPFNAANGDGGEQYALSNGVVSILDTKDGSQSGIQNFAGPDHWVVFRTDVTSAPKCLVANVGAVQAYTCYWRATVNYPNLGPIDSIISEHYNAANPAQATAMERAFYGLNLGRIVWQSWNSSALPTRAAIDTRCLDFGYNASPQPNWVLNDCREAVNKEAADGSLIAGSLWSPLTS